MKNHLLGFLLLAPLLAHAQAPIAYTLKGTIGQLRAPAKVYLLRGTQLLDSTTLKNGAFELKGTTDIPKAVELVVQRNGRLRDVYSASLNRTRLFLEPTPVVLTGPDSLALATLTGGQVTRDYQTLQAAHKPILAAADRIGAEVQHVSAEERKSPAFTQRMQEQFKEITQQLHQADVAFIKANPASWVSLDLLTSTMAVPQYAEVAPLYAALSPTLKATAVGQQYGKMLQSLKAVAVGAQAPNFTQRTPEGREVSLSDYRGKYVLVDFWASWCGPCRAENPSVLQAYHTYKNRNFTVLGVSLDEARTRDKWVKAIAEDKLPWTQVSDLGGFAGEAATRYHVQAIPQNFLLDPSGKIIAANLRGPELSAALARLLK